VCVKQLNASSHKPSRWIELWEEKSSACLVEREDRVDLVARILSKLPVIFYFHSFFFYFHSSKNRKLGSSYQLIMHIVMNPTSPYIDQFQACIDPIIVHSVIMFRSGASLG